MQVRRTGVCVCVCVSVYSNTRPCAQNSPDLSLAQSWRRIRMLSSRRAQRGTSTARRSGSADDRGKGNGASRCILLLGLRRTPPFESSNNSENQLFRVPLNKIFFVHWPSRGFHAAVAGLARNWTGEVHIRSSVGKWKRKTTTEAYRFLGR